MPKLTAITIPFAEYRYLRFRLLELHPCGTNIFRVRFEGVVKFRARDQDPVQNIADMKILTEDDIIEIEYSASFAYYHVAWKDGAFKPDGIPTYESKGAP